MLQVALHERYRWQTSQYVHQSTQATKQHQQSTEHVDCSAGACDRSIRKADLHMLRRHLLDLPELKLPRDLIQSVPKTNPLKTHPHNTNQTTITTRAGDTRISTVNKHLHEIRLARLSSGPSVALWSVYARRANLAKFKMTKRVAHATRNMPKPKNNTQTKHDCSDLNCLVNLLKAPSAVTSAVCPRGVL